MTNSKKRIWVTIAPIRPNECLELDEDIVFRNDVAIKKIPSDVRKEEILKHLSSYQKEQFESTEFCFSFRYSSAALGEDQSKAEQNIISANLSCWLAKASPLHFSTILHLEADPTAKYWIMRQSKVIDILRCLEKYSNAVLKKSDLEFASQISAQLGDVSGSLRTSIYNLWTALRQFGYETRYPLLWTSIEALFGSQNPQELSYRLTQRIAFFLAENREQAKQIAEQSDELYKLRSKFVHGRKPKKDASEEQMLQSENIVRNGLLKILMREDIKRIFSSTKDEIRDDYLQDAVYRDLPC